MIECNSNYISTIPKMKCPADCQQPNSGSSAVQLRRPTRTSNVSGEFLDRLADCPRLSSGLSATHFCNPTRTNYFSGQISNLYCGLSALKQRTVRSLTPQNHQRQRRLWTILNSTADRPNLLGGPSAVHSTNPPETTTSLDKILDSTTDCPLSNSGPSVVHSVKPSETTTSLGNF